MSIDIKRAFAYPFKDSEWQTKLIILGVFYIFYFLFYESFRIMTVVSQHHMGNVPNQPYMVLALLGVTFASSLIKLIPSGFICKSVNNLLNNNENLADWKGNYLYFLKIGFFSTLIFFVYFFIVGFVFGIGGFLSHTSPNHVPNINPVLILASVLTLIVVFICPYVSLSYCENFDFKQGFNLKKIFSLISKNFSDYIVAAIISIFLYGVFIVLSILLMCACIGILLAPLVAPIVELICLNLYTQAYKNALLRE